MIDLIQHTKLNGLKMSLSSLKKMEDLLILLLISHLINAFTSLVCDIRLSWKDTNTSFDSQAWVTLTMKILKL